MLAKLGYKQELSRTWSGFSNFAISFSIISILAGCLTTYGAGISNGGPVSISWSLADHLGLHPDHRLHDVRAGLGDADLGRASTTGPSKLGGPAAGFFTGWLNLIGLIAVTASVAYGCATFFELTFLDVGAGSTTFSLTRVFVIFLVILAADLAWSTSSPATCWR